MPIEKQGIILDGEPEFSRKQHGALISNGIEVATTLQCPHCGGHFISYKGSGIQRTYCLKCSGVTCGRPECYECFPIEKQLDMAEKGLIVLS